MLCGLRDFALHRLALARLQPFAAFGRATVEPTIVLPLQAARKPPELQRQGKQSEYLPVLLEIGVESPSILRGVRRNVRQKRLTGKSCVDLFAKAFDTPKHLRN
jgi:hypothetical protein